MAVFLRHGKIRQCISELASNSVCGGGCRWLPYFDNCTRNYMLLITTIGKDFIPYSCKVLFLASASFGISTSNGRGLCMMPIYGLGLILGNSKSPEDYRRMLLWATQPICVGRGCWHLSRATRMASHGRTLLENCDRNNRNSTYFCCIK